jgi:hypothetical protein
MSSARNGNIVLEPLAEQALTAEYARALMDQLERVVPRAKIDTRHSITVHCYRNQIMTREFARELFNLITGEYGVPKVRFIEPTADGAAYLFDAADDAGRRDALELRAPEGARSSGRACKTLGEYLALTGF